MQAKALTMLVSRKFSSPPARPYQGFKEDSASVFLAIQMFFLEKIWIFALRRPVARNSETRRRRLHSPVTRENLSETGPIGVLAGLVPAIHAAPLQSTHEVRGGPWAWMPGTRPRLSGSAKNSRHERQPKGNRSSRRLGRASRPSTPRRCNKPSELAASARRGGPGQARA